MGTLRDRSKHAPRRLAAAVAAVLAGSTVALALPTPSPAAAAPPPISFATPTISGIEIPPFAPPEGSFRQITVTAAPGPTTREVGAVPTVRFAVPHLLGYHYLYNYRYLVVDWRNLRTGKTGSERLRYVHTSPDASLWPMRLPTSAVAKTGAGPIVATVRILRVQYQAPPDQVQVIPGLNVLVLD